MTNASKRTVQKLVDRLIWLTNPVEPVSAEPKEIEDSSSRECIKIQECVEARSIEKAPEYVAPAAVPIVDAPQAPAAINPRLVRPGIVRDTLKNLAVAEALERAKPTMKIDIPARSINFLDALKVFRGH